MAANIYQIVISYSAGGQFAENILHYAFDDSGFSTTASAALALITAFDAANKTPLRNLLPVGVTILSYKGRCVSVPGGFEAVLFATGSSGGTRTGGLALAGTGPCVTMYAGGAGYARGRCFLPGVSETDAIDGEFSTSFITAFNANAHLFTDTLTLVGGGAPVAGPGIWRRKPPKQLFSIGHVALCPFVATQRRRQTPA